MIKSNKDIFEVVSKSTNIEQSEVKNALDFFWKKATATIEDYDNTEIYIYGLGTFTARRHKIYQLIKYYEVKRARIRENTRLKETTKDIILKECEDNLRKLEALKAKYINQDESRKQFKQTRSEETDGNLHKPIGDLARTEEQPN